MQIKTIALLLCATLPAFATSDKQTAVSEPTWQIHYAYTVGDFDDPEMKAQMNPYTIEGYGNQFTALHRVGDFWWGGRLEFIEVGDGGGYSADAANSPSQSYNLAGIAAVSHVSKWYYGLASVGVGPNVMHVNSAFQNCYDEEGIFFSDGVDCSLEWTPPANDWSSRYGIYLPLDLQGGVRLGPVGLGLQFSHAYYFTMLPKWIVSKQTPRIGIAFSALF